MTDVDNVFLVVMHSSALGAGGEERALHNQTRNLLRAIDMNAKGARVFRQRKAKPGERGPGPSEWWEEVVYDSFGDDMGHHPGHDEPFTAQPVEPSIESQLPIPTRLSMSDPSLQRMPTNPLSMSARITSFDRPATAMELKAMGIPEGEPIEDIETIAIVANGEVVYHSPEAQERVAANQQKDFSGCSHPQNMRNITEANEYCMLCGKSGLGGRS